MNFTLTAVLTIIRNVEREREITKYRVRVTHTHGGVKITKIPDEELSSTEQLLCVCTGVH
jgi:hypothetical protein